MPLNRSSVYWRSKRSYWGKKTSIQCVADKGMHKDAKPFKLGLYKRVVIGETVLTIKRAIKPT